MIQRRDARTFKNLYFAIILNYIDEYKRIKGVTFHY